MRSEQPESEVWGRGDAAAGNGSRAAGGGGASLKQVRSSSPSLTPYMLSIIFTVCCLWWNLFLDILERGDIQMS